MRRRIVLLGASAMLLALPIVGHAQDSTSANPSAPAASAPSETKPAKPAKGTKSAKTTMAKADLNSADKDMLMKIQGVTSDLADKIIAGRPYKNRGELLSKKVLTKEEYAKVRNSVMVKVEKKAK